MGEPYNAVMSAERALRRAKTSEEIHDAVKYLVNLPGYSSDATVHRILTDHKNFTLKSDGESDRSLMDMLLILSEYLPLRSLLTLASAPSETFHSDLWHFRNHIDLKLLILKRFRKLAWDEAVGHLRYLASFRHDVHYPIRIITLVRSVVPWPGPYASIAKAMIATVDDNHERALMRGWRSLIILASRENGRGLSDLFKD
jgi:hypothetical protein